MPLPFRKMAEHEQVAMGVDGCPGGWIAAIKFPGQALAWHFSGHFEGILQAAPPKACILVDMIIGLPEAASPRRLCDHLARRKISPYSSRVFSAPPRESLSATDYTEACSIARRATGKAISRQTYFLIEKIRQLDVCSDDSRLHESHPELVFARFNKGQPIAASKKLRAGHLARIRLLESVLSGSANALASARTHLPREKVGPDDCLDALALCAAAARPEKLIRLPEDPGQPGIWY